MHLAAKMMRDHHQGRFPDTYEAVIALPGIGKYTAGAIMSIAYQKPYSALDGNVVRVLSRYLGNANDMREEKNRKVLDQYNQTQIEHAHPEVYTQAMMELGATICRPKQPKCELCPLNHSCIAYQQKQVHVYPFMSKLKEKKVESYITLVIHHENGIYLRKRTESLLNGMYEYPQFEFESIVSVTQLLERQGITVLPSGDCKAYRHLFTHKIWHLNVYHVTLIGVHHHEWIWFPMDKIQQIPMSMAHRQISMIE